MKTLARIFGRRSKGTSARRGSALLVSLMVMVGLSLLGLAFVAISETESAISVNERNASQTLALAEAGARLVSECFNDPQWARNNNLFPANADNIKTQRVTTFYTGRYKPDNAGQLLLDRPYRPALADRFIGDVDHADIIINTTTPAGYLTALNNQLTTDPTAGQITEIRVFAPPMVGATLNANGFWEGGTRYGVATVRVTAEKRIASTTVARSMVKAVLSEWPLPNPDGAVQTSAQLNPGGDQNIHWGKATGDGGVAGFTVNAANTAMPWFDATNMAHFEHGYDSSDEWKNNTAYLLGAIVRPTAAKLAANPTMAGIEYVCVQAGTSAVALASEPTWYNGPVQSPPRANIIDNGARWQERWPTGYPNNTNGVLAYYDNFNWLYELAGRSVADPWFEVRTRGAVNGIGPAPQPYKYNAVTQNPFAVGTAGHSCIFQYQTMNQITDYKETNFPPIRYDIWKQLAILSQGTQGIHYFVYDSASTNFKENGVGAAKTFAQWVNYPAEPGFYFFDTTDGTSPQVPGVAPANLTPAPAIPGTFLMRGFIYLNAVSIDSGSAMGPAPVSDPVNPVLNNPSWFGLPGEPFRDVGYRKVATVTPDSCTPTEPPIAQVVGSFMVHADGTVCIEGANDGGWSYQDLPWSNGAVNAPNGKFDVYVKQKTFKRGDGTTTTQWLPVPYTPGCTPGDNATLGVVANGCSEPHEPYLNFIYPTAVSDYNSFSQATMGVTVGWQAPGSEDIRPKKMINNDSAPATCPGATRGATEANCTSNAYDRDGVLLQFQPILQGVFYQEGTWTTSGGGGAQNRYFGSCLINSRAATGTNPAVYFDENLKKGQWPPRSWKLSRVYISLLQTQQ